MSYVRERSGAAVHRTWTATTRSRLEIHESIAAARLKRGEANLAVTIRPSKNGPSYLSRGNSACRTTENIAVPTAIRTAIHDTVTHTRRSGASSCGLTG